MGRNLYENIYSVYALVSHGSVFILFENIQKICENDYFLFNKRTLHKANRLTDINHEVG
jgi:hypothetical protein